MNDSRSRDAARHYEKRGTHDCDVVNVGIGAAEEFRMQDITWHIPRTSLDE